MSKSYQDLDTRLRTLEAKVNLLMSCATVTARKPSSVHPLGYTEETITMFDLYRTLQQEGAQLENVTNGTDE